MAPVPALDLTTIFEGISPAPSSCGPAVGLVNRALSPDPLLSPTFRGSIDPP